MTKHRGYMNCPTCPLIHLEKHRVIASSDGREIEVDRCPQCHGVWFDAGELHDLIEVADEKVRVPRGASDARAYCPRCDGNLMRFYYPQTYVQIEACKHCSGIWIDKDELREIYMVRQHLRDREFHPDLDDTVAEWYESMEQ
ncbi:MAG: zf-TFIIB domain-containing protein [Planctomycetota bacterium]|jgi:Zn-finger nucleic acid-binding protein